MVLNFNCHRLHRPGTELIPSQNELRDILCLRKQKESRLIRR